MQNNQTHSHISTILAFTLIPLSGFATDIYIPSLSSMAGHLAVSNAAVQLSLIVFMISYGISQLFVGSLLDSFGRYSPGLIALLFFAMASFTIAGYGNIHIIYLMRAVQGLAVSVIVVGKRAYFMDVFRGEKLKHYTSLFSIIWATAPVVAPFIGGYLESIFGWASNFYFLGIATLLLFILELKYSKESLTSSQPFKLNRILKVYLSTVTAFDFTLGLIVISLSYSMLIVYGLSAPFIIEHVYHLSPVITGYCSLMSGVSLMIGGVISKLLINRKLTKKLMVAVSLQIAFAALMFFTSGFEDTLLTLMIFTAAVHLLSGFLFNNIFAYCLGRFTENAGIVSGITGGSLYVITSIISYGTVSIIAVKNATNLGLIYFGFALLAGLLLLVFFKVKNVALKRSVVTNNV